VSIQRSAIANRALYFSWTCLHDSNFLFLENLLMSNPVLSSQLLPAFQQIKPSDFEPAFDQVLAENRDLVQQVVASGADTWETLYVPLDEAGDNLSRVWSLIGHYNSVLNSDEMRGIYKSTLAKMTYPPNSQLQVWG
jgi:Zn-dependent oligopeptidase